MTTIEDAYKQSVAYVLDCATRKAYAFCGLQYNEVMYYLSQLIGVDKMAENLGMTDFSQSMEARDKIIEMCGK